MASVDIEKKLGLRGKTIKLDESTGLTVVNEGVNKLLERLEVDVRIEHVFGGTPSRAVLRKAIAKLYGVPEDVVIVKNIVGEYGIGSSRAHVHIYSDVGKMISVEPKYVLKRNGVSV